MKEIVQKATYIILIIYIIFQLPEEIRKLRESDTTGFGRFLEVTLFSLFVALLPLSLVNLILY